MISLGTKFGIGVERRMKTQFGILKPGASQKPHGMLRSYAG